MSLMLYYNCYAFKDLKVCMSKCLCDFTSILYVVDMLMLILQLLLLYVMPSPMSIHYNILQLWSSKKNRAI